MRPTTRTSTAALLVTLCALVAAVLLGGPAVAAPAPPPPPLTEPTTPPATCPDQVAPPAAIDTSEVPAPGQTSPAPVPEPSVPAGGPRMAECGYVLPPNAPPLPTDLGFESWVLQDLDTGAVLAARDPHARQRPASLIKLLLSQVVAQNLDPNTPVVGTQDDANQQGTRVGLGPGGQYTVGLLVHALLMASGNDVAYALATQLGGVPTTLDKMNALASRLGMADTRAASPSGLDAPGMSTSAYDLSLIFKLDLSTPLIADAVHTTQISFPGYGPKPGYMVNNDNELLRTYPGDLGGKTGYTDDAQQTYANAAVQNGHRIALVMTRGTNHLAGRWKNARELMDYGFALENAHTAPVGTMTVPAASDLSASSSVRKLANTVPTTGHGNAQVAGVPTPGMTTFGTVGLPVTILAGVAVVLIGLLYLKRRKDKRKRAARAAAAASAQTVRVPIPPELRAKPAATATGTRTATTRPNETPTRLTETPARAAAQNGTRQLNRPPAAAPTTRVPATNGASAPTRAMPTNRPKLDQPTGQPNGVPAPAMGRQGNRSSAGAPAVPRPAAAPRPQTTQRPAPAQRPTNGAPRPAPEWPAEPEWPQ